MCLGAVCLRVRVLMRVRALFAMYCVLLYGLFLCFLLGFACARESVLASRCLCVLSASHRVVLHELLLCCVFVSACACAI